MIRSFGNKPTAALFVGVAPKALPSALRKRVREKLDALHAATTLDDLKAPPANRLEKLGGDRAGQWSVRINDQWRLCFAWRDGDAWDAEIVDYH